MTTPSSDLVPICNRIVQIADIADSYNAFGESETKRMLGKHRFVKAITDRQFSPSGNGYKFPYVELIYGISNTRFMITKEPIFRVTDLAHLEEIEGVEHRLLINRESIIKVEASPYRIGIRGIPYTEMNAAMGKL